MRNQEPCVCDRLDGCHSADDCRPASLVAEVKDDISRNRMRERLQVLEAWKLEADETELQWIEGHEAYLKYLLDPTAIPTSSHEPGWFETRRKAGEYHDDGDLDEMMRV